MHSQKKTNASRGKMMSYLRRDGLQNIMVETNDQAIKRFRAVDFHPYYKDRDTNQLILLEDAMGVATRLAKGFIPAIL